MQFNCVNSETLKDAQLQPENFRDLIVRVAGFSAYFVTLDKLGTEARHPNDEVSKVRVAGFSAYFVTLDKLTQDEIIKRTELKWS